MIKNFRIILMLITIIPFLSGCGFKSFEKFVRTTMTVEDALTVKDTYDKADNPAKKYLISRDMGYKLIELKDVVVKDVVPSTDIDYDFCVIVQVPHEKGIIMFYIYSRDVNTIAKLEKGKTKILALGDFRRFFSLLDNSYLKIDVTDADISIIE